MSSAEYETMPKDPKVKQTRKRIPRTCAQCRKRKQKCDSLLPCAVCRLRGEGDQCDYEGAQPTRVLDKDDGSSTPISAAELQRLRSQLDGLETLVSKVVYKNSGNRNDDEGSIVELEESDIALKLVRMMSTRTLVPSVGQEAPIVERVRVHCREAAKTRPEWGGGRMSVSNALMSQYNQSEQELYSIIPNINQAALLYHTYWVQFEWYHASFPRARFEKDLDTFYNRDRDLVLSEDDNDLRWILMATLFAVARLAVMRIPSAEAMTKGLPVATKDRTALSHDWLSASLSCLNRANFEARPRIESIICLVVLLEAMWFDGPIGGLDDTGLLYELKCKAMNLAFDLGLHRDPSHRDPARLGQSPVGPGSPNGGPGVGSLDVDACHQRRMLWWALLSLDGLYCAIAGRVSSLVSLDAVDVYLPALSAAPAEGDRHEGCPPNCQVATQVTGVKPRLLIGFVAHEIWRLSLRRSPPPTIRDLHKAHRDLSSLEAHLPPTHKLFDVNHKIDRNRLPTCTRARRDAFSFYLRFYFLAMKLHRPLHTVRKADELTFDPSYHRGMVVHFALLLLDLRKVTDSSPHFVLGSLISITAGISLALDLLLEPTSDEAPLIRQELESLTTFLQPATSAMARRGTAVLDGLLQVVNGANVQALSNPGAMSSLLVSDEGPVSPTSWSHGPFHQPTEIHPYSSFSPYDPTGRTQALPVFQPMQNDGIDDMVPTAGPPVAWQATSYGQQVDSFRPDASTSTMPHYAYAAHAGLQNGSRSQAADFWARGGVPT